MSMAKGRTGQDVAGTETPTFRDRRRVRNIRAVVRVRSMTPDLEARFAAALRRIVSGLVSQELRGTRGRNDG
jgi:hypothetical protein